MERLWTPWRRAYLEGSDTRPGGCFLCAIVTAPGDDRKNLVLLRAEHVFVLLNLYPYNSGHLMVAPYAHTGDLARLDGQLAAEMMHVTQRSVALLEQVYSPEAFNVGMNLGKPARAQKASDVCKKWNCAKCGSVSRRGSQLGRPNQKA